MKKVAILGTAPGWEDAPFDDKTWEIWGISRLYSYIPRWTRWYEFHRLEEVCETWADGDKAQEAASRRVYHDWLREQTQPIYVQEERPDMVPNGIRFPIEDIQRWVAEKTGEDKPEQYFTNTISYLIAHALFEGASEIGVYGVDMALDSEFGTQRPSCEYFIGLARGMGVKTTIPERSDLLKATELYAYGSASGLRKKLAYKRVELQGRLNHTKKELTKGRAAMNALEGAMRLLGEQVNNGFVTEEHAAKQMEELENDLKQITGEIDKGRLIESALRGNLDMADYIERNWLHGIS